MIARRVCYFVFTATVLVLIGTKVVHWMPSNYVVNIPVQDNSLSIAPTKQAELMSPEEIIQYLHWTNSTSCQLAVDFGFDVAVWGGMAAPDGQKAVCLDQVISPVYGKCLVYSFGIKNLWSFDEDMAQFGCQVYSFDPSMGVDDHNRTDHIHFFNLGLAGKDEVNAQGWNMKTASSIYRMLSGHHGASTLIDVLKIDIEFYEWEVILQMLKSGFLAEKVLQFAVEIHFHAEDPLEIFQGRVRILQDLESTYPLSYANDIGGFVRFSSRPNPGLKRPLTILGGKEGYIGFEVAWYNSRFYNSNGSHSKERVFPYYK